MSEKIIKEVMALVDDFALKTDAYQNKEVSKDDLLSARRAVRVKLRELLVRKPLTDEQIEQATGTKIGQPLFLAAKGFVLATERAHGIGS